MNTVYSYKCWYEIRKEKEIPVWYTGIKCHISSTNSIHFSVYEIVITSSLLFAE